jgi:hypothetical protein
MTDLSMFAQYNKLADMLIAKASKDQIAECARLLALNLAHYQSKFGDLPLEETLAMIDADVPNDDQAKLLVLGMENLVGVLGTVCSGLGESKH